FTELASEDPDLLKDIEEVERSLAKSRGDAEGLGFASSSILKVVAYCGKLSLHVDKTNGTGDCERKGAGGFTGSAVPSTGTQAGGTYKLYITNRLSCRLELYKDGNNFHTYNGSGIQKGLSNRDGNPWVGQWSL
ncbi:hypothetical protein F5146DRAFT_937142, partial [Armillaria mellea]